MNIKTAEELLLRVEKNNDILIEQTKTKPKETLEVQLTKSLDTFPLDPP